MTGTSGRTSRAPFAFYDPASRSLRTSQTTFESDFPTSSPTLPPSGSMRGGALYAHPTWAPPTSGAGWSSLRSLPTPTARDWKGAGYDGQLPNAVALLPMPRTSDTNGAGAHGDGGPDLWTAVSLLPTPTVADSRTTANRRADGTPYGSGYGMTLTDASRRLLPTPTASDGERRSATYGRGNPTLSGAVSSPPSDAGSTSPDGPPPGQLTLWGA